MKTKRIPTKQARPGMVTATDIFSSNDQLIIPHNFTLTDHAIARLEFYSIREITIAIDDGSSTKPSEPARSELSYAEEIKQSPEYKQFNQEYLSSLDTFKSVVSDFINNGLKKIDISNLLELTKNVLSESRNGIHVFHMLHCMRDYDDLTFIHSLNVALIANSYGKWIHMNEKDLDILTLCGLLHDVGKLVIPKAIIAKPTALTEDEMAIIQTHPTRGYNLLNNLNIDIRIKYATLMHHEKCDGSGYPSGLTYNQIHEFAKIITIIDVYDAMTSARVYRGPVCPFDVINIFETEGLQKYDPAYLLPFLKGIVDTYLHNSVLLSDGRKGEIILINQHSLSKPIVKVGRKFIDLSTKSNLYIKEII